MVVGLHGGPGSRQGALIGTGRANLATLLHEHHMFICLVAIDERPKTLPGLWVVNGCFPLALVGVDDMLHLLL